MILVHHFSYLTSTSCILRRRLIEICIKIFFVPFLDADDGAHNDDVNF